MFLSSLPSLHSDTCDRPHGHLRPSVVAQTCRTESTFMKTRACGCTNLFVSGKTDPCLSPSPPPSPPRRPHSKRQATDSTDSSDSYHLRSQMGSPACVPRFSSSSSIIQRLGRTRTHKQQQLPPPPPSRAQPITPNIVCALDSERPPRPVNAELQLVLVA